MKKGRYIAIIFLIFFFLAMATILAFIYSEFSRPPEIGAASYLEIGLGGPLPELAEPDFLTAYVLGRRPLSVHDVWENLRKAKVDGRIRCVLVRLGDLGGDWAKASELRDAILDFRRSGKKVYAYIEEAPEFDKEYYLATACDRIILHPLGWLGVNGLGGWVPFIKEGLDKLGIEAEFEHVEEYKTAYNMFTEKGFTPAHRAMLESLEQDIFNDYVRTAAAARKMTEEDFRSRLDQGLFQGGQAKDAGLVDDLMYDDELRTLLRDESRDLERTSLAEYNRVSPTSLGLETGRRIALIYAVGPIISGEGFYETIGGRTFSRWLRRARQDRSVAAIVLRVDSPGGSSVGSDVIWREVQLAKKDKPVVVSMSDLAGSGGYWISMAAHKIVAQPQTLTGSIGVIAGKFNLAGLYGKLGITAEKMTFGPRADMFSTFRPLSPDERKLLKDQILWTYDRFLTKAAEGRNMTRADVDKVGKGRVWTGRQAKDIRLVDETGGLTMAIGQAKKLAGIPAEEEVAFDVWPKSTTLLGAIFGRQDAAVKWPLPEETGKLLTTLQALEKQNPLSVMPFWLPIQ
ncbi:MAG: signal peptide peptidase SppA [Candidatus Aminicenantes bacterium RBG_16_63_16]|nr:MAG: signal peptide peptidase SppA [Candidatus Aminicenantes bacterium RBG_16_63_16]